MPRRKDDHRDGARGPGSGQRSGAGAGAGSGSGGADRGRGEQRLSDARLGSGTGRSAAEWFARLDAAGATRLSHEQISRLLVDEFEVVPWWAEGITVRYEQERGVEPPGRQPDGSYAVTVGRSLRGAPLELLDLAIERFAGYAGGRPDAVARSATQPTAVWALAHGDTLHLRVVPTGGPKCSVTLTQGSLRLPERVQPVKEGLTRAFGVMGDRQN
ncbi:hypothetical protein ITJ55_10080 [Frigoribacterium sp. VKM Ac-1396]|uniref:hypothetical protein n=1 Tax=Frigoribacterium sp. VKM Ac-1396 TaxID=2783821 RepID=UPI00188BA21B|nr:hypothetical protein [Frigoribacterium sp. VKM Ac-1396]MBF4601158.1 hypothetical protein [Frigoribacterium sp. VKM Ac-1396]